MSNSGTVALLVCSLTVVAIVAALPFITYDPREKVRPRRPILTAVAALIGLCLSGRQLDEVSLNSTQIIDAVVLTSGLLLGILVKWTMETIAQRKPEIHETTLAATLLTSSLTVALGPVFADSPNPRSMLLWFLCGYACHTFFSDFERCFTREKVVIRRREPPTLPYDFRKPEVG